MLNYTVRKTYIHILIIALLGILVYSNTFDASFHFDDASNIVNNPIVKDFKYFLSPSQADSLNFPYKDSMVWVLKTRYIGALSFYLSYKIGGLDVAGYHIFNLLVHILNALLVYALVRLMLSAMNKEETKSPLSEYVPLFSALLFVVHPIQTQAVTYIVQRFTSLATMFYLLSLVLYMKFRSSGKVFAYIFALISAVLAMKTKEIAFTLPIVITLCEIMFFKGDVKKRFLYLIPFLLTMFIIPLTLIGMKDGISDGIGSAARLATDMSRWDYLLTQFRVIATYLRLLIIPINQNFDYDYPVYNSLLNGEVLLSFLLHVSLISLAVYLFKRNRLASLGILWFYITLSVESSVIPILDVIFEHRVYLPSVGAIMAVASTSYLFKRKVFIAVFLALTLFLSYLSYDRNNVWKSELSLWEDVVRKSPNKARAHYMLGNAYQMSGFADKAIASYRRTLSIQPDLAEAHNELGLALSARGLVGEALSHFREAVRLKSDEAEFLYNLGLSYLDNNLPIEAKEVFERALRVNPDFLPAKEFLGRIESQK